MESNSDSSINSGEEMEMETLDSGVGINGRSYDCIFCKRGFNTAQALGGHMNIHRKNRPKIKSNSTQHLLHPPPPPPLSTATSPPSTHQPPPLPPTPSTYPHFLQPLHRHQPPPSVDNWSPFRFRFVEDSDRNRLPEMDHHKEDLDLELRLGYYHS